MTISKCFWSEAFGILSKWMGLPKRCRVEMRNRWVSTHHLSTIWNHLCDESTDGAECRVHWYLIWVHAQYTARKPQTHLCMRGTKPMFLLQTTIQRKVQFSLQLQPWQLVSEFSMSSFCCSWQTLSLSQWKTDGNSWLSHSRVLPCVLELSIYQAACLFFTHHCGQNFLMYWELQTNDKLCFTACSYLVYYPRMLLEHSFVLQTSILIKCDHYQINHQLRLFYNSVVILVLVLDAINSLNYLSKFKFTLDGLNHPVMLFVYLTVH